MSAHHARCERYANENMRELYNVFVQDRDQPTFRARKKKGRPAKRVMMSLTLDSLPSDFYLTVARLHEKDIPAFIREYTPAMPNTAELVTMENILDFQKDLQKITLSLDTINDADKKDGKARGHFRTYVLAKRAAKDEQWNFLEVVNRYLKDTHLQLIIAPLLSRELSEAERKTYANELESMETKERKGEDHPGFLSNDVLNAGRETKNTKLLRCESNSLLSWCVLNLIADKLLLKRNVGVCDGCGRLFIPVRKNRRYCDDSSCGLKARAAARARAAYHRSEAKIN
jgi:predicted RNA-binding Zn ribbon-like protein